MPRSSRAPFLPLTATLGNGAKAVSVRLPGVHRVSILTLIRVGSRYETEKNRGISHLLEHMLYRGIPGHPTAHDLALAFERFGGSLDATTGPDVGTLGVSCPPEHFEKALHLLSRVYSEPLLRGLRVEKGIVREEILEDLDEKGKLVDGYDLLRGMAFGGHPLGFPVIGTVRHVDRFGVPGLRRHHRKHYVGAGTVVAVAGPLDPEQVLRAVERRFSSVPAGAPIPVEPPSPANGPAFRHVDTASSQTVVRVGFRGGGTHDPDEPATALLLRVLDDGNATRLYSRLCDELGLAYDVTGDREATEDAGLLHIGCGMAHAAAVTVTTEIFGVLRALRDHGPSAAEVDKAKARHRFGLDVMLDDAEEVAAFLAEGVLRGSPLTPAEWRSRVDAETRRSVRSAAERLLCARNLSAVSVGFQSKRGAASLERLVRGFS